MAQVFPFIQVFQVMPPISETLPWLAQLQIIEEVGYFFDACDSSIIESRNLKVFPIVILECFDSGN
jgi:hypothetical protein